MAWIEGSVAGKVAIITGGNRGMGLKTAGSSGGAARAWS
jgi:NAD(P)-dependent dehydrogenase (short-subunit alcohol dehydrogenase family)